MDVKLNSTYRNNNPYNGEGSIMVVQFDGESRVKCLHVDHVKYPGLNGGIEIKWICDIEDYYHEIK